MQSLTANTQQIMRRKLYLTENSADLKKATFNDYRGWTVNLTKRRFEGLKTDYILQIPDVLKNPHEVWMYLSQGLYTYVYLQFYQGKALVLEMDFNATREMRVKRFDMVTGKRITDLRKGVLLYSKENENREIRL